MHYRNGREANDEFYHAGEDVADDGKTIVAVIAHHHPGWASCWDERVCTVPRERVVETVKRLNTNPELVGFIEGTKAGIDLARSQRKE